MKKFIVLLAVVALTLISSMAFAEISVSGMIDTRSLNVNNKDHNDLAADRDAKTQTRVRLMVDGKAGDAKARIQLENDWDTWGRFESAQGNARIIDDGGRIKLREAWVDVPLPLGGLHLRGGHQLLQLGHGWWFRSMKFGSDAWVMYTDIGALHLGFVNVKADEGEEDATDDTDAYVVVASYKMSDTMKVGVDITDFKKRQIGNANPSELMNISANFAGKIGPADLKAQVDLQMGDDGGSPAVDFSGMGFVVQASIPMDPLVITATLGYGSGDDQTTADENEGLQTKLDADPHYAAIYEYLVGQPARFGVGAHQGFANTLAIGVGAAFKVAPSLTLGVDLWKLAANEAPAGADDDLGMEVDLKVNWKLADNVTWNWTVAQHMVGDAYGANADDTTAIIGVLGVKF